MVGKIVFWLIGLSNALLLQWLTVKLSFTIWYTCRMVGHDNLCFILKDSEEDELVNFKTPTNPGDAVEIYLEA